MKHIRGVIFDLDGTLVTSTLDFVAIRNEIDCPDGLDVLTYLEQLPEAQRQQAQTIIHRHELLDAERCEWMPGAQAFVEKCSASGYPMAIVTRNSHQSSWVKIEQASIPIDTVITRENSRPKPDPTALLDLANQFALPTGQLLMVGDYKYDLQAARNAAMPSCLINYSDLPDYAHLADYTFANFDLLAEAMFA